MSEPSIYVKGTGKGRVLEYYQGSMEYSSMEKIILSSLVSV